MLGSPGAQGRYRQPKVSPSLWCIPIPSSLQGDTGWLKLVMLGAFECNVFPDTPIWASPFSRDSFTGDPIILLLGEINC